MSKMATVPVFVCKAPGGCFKRVYGIHLSTTIDDPEGKLLDQLMSHLGDKALCEFHKAQYNYYAARNMGDAWWKGQVP